MRRIHQICVENKIMFKAVYFFPTTILCFKNVSKSLPNKLYGYKKIDFNKEKVLCYINKKPDMHAYRAG